MKKIISVMICLLFLLSVSAVSSSALPNVNVIVGDVDLDQSITVLDATCIQKSLVGMEELSYLQEVAADVDNDGSRTVVDATWIQRYIASIKSKQTTINEWIYYGFLDESFTSDKGDRYIVVPKGDTVTFEASGETPELFLPVTYEFYINDEVVQERGEDSAFAYTFDKAGRYTVKVRIYNRADWYEERTISLDVTEAQETVPTQSEA
ncbi:MAG: PKD domain-containing protein [Ruminococcus sp.]|nr:PKD domain-containing protein [Ruminococcus sp.]